MGNEQTDAIEIADATAKDRAIWDMLRMKAKPKPHAAILVFQTLAKPHPAAPASDLPNRGGEIRG